MVCSISGSFIRAHYLKVPEIIKKTGSRQRVRGELRILSNIEGGAFCKNSQTRKVVHYFCKNIHLGCLTRF